MRRAAARDLVVAGGSAGAVEPLREILAALPPDFPAAIVVALHRQATPQDSDSLTRALSHHRLPTHSARDGATLEAGHVYIAPADQHLLVDHRQLRIEHSPKEHRFRPCIDVLFKSASASYGRRVIGVLLSGAFGDDGTAGLWQITNRGGLAVAQLPSDAQFGAMPDYAIEHTAITHVLSAADIGPALVRLTRRRTGEPTARVLLVNANTAAVEALQHDVDSDEVDVSAVATGEDAIERAAREHFDLVVMDVQLSGGLSGVDTARQLWRTHQMPVVYCTALTDRDTLRAVQTPECYGFVVKPFHARAIRAAIALALGRRDRELRYGT